MSHFSFQFGCHRVTELMRNIRCHVLGDQMVFQLLKHRLHVFMCQILAAYQTPAHINLRMNVCPWQTL
jgi:hypothetical protein